MARCLSERTFCTACRVPSRIRAAGTLGCTLFAPSSILKTAFSQLWNESSIVR